MVNRGEIWWYETPDQKRRPYLILTRSVAIPVLDDLLAVPATRTIRNIPSEIVLDEKDGMPVPCVLSVDNTSLVNKRYLVESITKLNSAKLEEVCQALNFVSSC